MIWLFEGDWARLVEFADPAKGSLVNEIPVELRRIRDGRWIERVIASGAQVSMSVGSASPVEDATRRWLKILSRLEITGLRAFPIRIGEGLLGILLLEHEPSGPELSPQLRSRLQDLADHLGLALDHYLQTQDSASRLARLHASQTILSALGTTGRLDRKLEVIARNAIGERQGDAALILRWDAERQVLIFGASANIRSYGIRDVEIRMGEGIGGQVATTRRPMLVRDANDLGAFRRRNQLHDGPLVAVHALPLLFGNRLVGVLELLHRADPPENDPIWPDFIQAVAAGAAVAIGQDSEQSARLSEGQPNHQVIGLTAHQTAIARLVRQGKTNAEIAAEVHRSESTVRFHLQAIYRRLGVPNRTALAARAVRGGWD